MYTGYIWSTNGWSRVVDEDSDLDYVKYCLRWSGYDLYSTQILDENGVLVEELSPRNLA